MKELVALKGQVKLRLNKSAGGVLLLGDHNLVTTLGEESIAEIIISNDGSTPSPSHIAIGDGDLDLDASHTALQGTEHDRQAATVARVSNDISYTASFSHSGASVNVNEVGLFNDAVAGIMFARFLSQNFLFTDGDNLEIAWTLTVGG